MDDLNGADRELLERLRRTVPERPDALTVAETILEPDSGAADYLTRYGETHPEQQMLEQFLTALEMVTSHSHESGEEPNRLRVLLARLLPSPPQLAPAMGVRGVSAPQLLVYEAEPVRITLRVQPDPAHRERLRLVGMIANLPARSLSVTLLPAAGAPIELRTVGSNFQAGNLVTGGYDLIIAGDEQEIHVQAVVLE